KCNREQPGRAAESRPERHLPRVRPAMDKMERTLNPGPPAPEPRAWSMRITIVCPRCDTAKRPLKACAACGAAGGIAEIAAWREQLHRHHLGVIMAEPQRGPGPPASLPRPPALVGALDELV